MASSSTTSVDKKVEAEGSVHAYKPTLSARDVDVAANITAGKEIDFTPEEAAAVRYVAVPHSESELLIYSSIPGERLTGISCRSCAVSKPTFTAALHSLIAITSAWVTVLYM